MAKNYDDLGNRITLNNRAGNDVVYAHNVANEYTSIGGTNVSHDAAGNLTADPNGYTYEYDNDNRLTKIKKDSGTTTVAEYTYDALGRRIEAIDSVAATTTRYYYDGWRVLSETDASGEKQRHYVYGNYLDEAVMLIHDDGEATPTYTDYYYAHNHLYSPTALINASGTVVERYEYDAYGKPTIMDDSYNARSSSNYDNVVMFTGQRLDTLDSGDLCLMNYKMRFYCPTTGRFLQRDPAEYIDGLNMYEYVTSSPSRFKDPYGLVTGKIKKWVLKKIFGLFANQIRQKVLDYLDETHNLGKEVTTYTQKGARPGECKSGQKRILYERVQRDYYNDIELKWNIESHVDDDGGLSDEELVEVIDFVLGVNQSFAFLEKRAIIETYICVCPEDARRARVECNSTKILSSTQKYLDLGTVPMAPHIEVGCYLYEKDRLETKTETYYPAAEKRKSSWRDMFCWPRDRRGLPRNPFGR